MTLGPVGRRVFVVGLGETPDEGMAEHIRIEDQPCPDPATLGPDEAIIAVRSAGISWVDVIMTAGLYQHQPRLPYTPGLEYSGEVLAVGAAVDPSQVAVGDRVFVDCFTVGPRTSGPYQGSGGFASYAVTPASALRPIPDGFSFDQACNFAGNYETAYHCLIALSLIHI